MHIHAVVTFAILLLNPAVANETTNLNKPLTAEQRSIYRFVLTQIVKSRKSLDELFPDRKSDEVLPIADRTFPFEKISDQKLQNIQRREDLKGVSFKRPRGIFISQHLDRDLISDFNNIRLVNLDLSPAYSQASPPAGVLSEIIFDKEHLYAVIAYAGFRGPQKVTALTQVLKKVDGQWQTYGFNYVSIAENHYGTIPRTGQDNCDPLIYKSLKGRLFDRGAAFNYDAN